VSRRNSLESKRARREATASRGDLPGRTDLVAWVKMRHRCSTTKAMKIILTGCLKVDSHIVGRKELPNGATILDRFIPSHLARRIVVVDAEL
jgi:hypothetical protein